MICPYCTFKFNIMAATGHIDASTVAPIICESCSLVSLLERGHVRKFTAPEYAAAKLSPAWALIERFQQIIEQRGPLHAKRA